MTKGIGINAIRAVRSHTFEEAATDLRVSISSMGNCLRTGLPSLRADYPIVVHGPSFKRWRATRKVKKHIIIAKHELFCPRCKMLKPPGSGMADCRPQTFHTLRPSALCVHCGAPTHRVIHALPLRASIDPK